MNYILFILQSMILFMHFKIVPAIFLKNIKSSKKYFKTFSKKTKFIYDFYN
jgi:hypothetical protein